MKAKVDYVDADDGCFYMDFVDFCQHFDDIYICRFFDKERGWINYDPIFSRWQGSTAGGCTNFDSVIQSPQYLLHITQPTTVVISLAQDDVRGSGDGKYLAISIEIYNNEGQKIEKRHPGEMVASNPESYIFRREVSVQATLQPLGHPYSVLISTFNPGEESDFIVQYYSTKPIKFDLMK